VAFERAVQTAVLQRGTHLHHVGGSPVHRYDRAGIRGEASGIEITPLALHQRIEAARLLLRASGEECEHDPGADAHRARRRHVPAPALGTSSDHFVQRPDGRASVARTISARTPAAVTSRPAPGPRTTSGSGYLRVR